MTRSNNPMTRSNKMTRSKKMKSVSLLAGLLLICAAVPVMAQAPPPPALLADHYDISATLDPITQTLSAVAKVDFKAREVSGSVRVELHPNLRQLKLYAIHRPAKVMPLHDSSESAAINRIAPRRAPGRSQ